MADANFLQISQFFVFLKCKNSLNDRMRSRIWLFSKVLYFWVMVHRTPDLKWSILIVNASEIIRAHASCWSERRVWQEETSVVVALRVASVRGWKQFGHATWLVRRIDTRTTRLLMTVITALLTTFPRPRAVFSQCRNSNIMRALVRKTECQNSKPMNPAGRSYCTADNVKSVQRYSA